MSESQMNREGLNNAADEVGRRVVEGTAPASELTAEHIRILQAAGIPNDTIAQLLRAEGFEEQDVAGYASEFGSAAAGPTSSGIIIQTICVGTCRSITIEVGVTRLCPQNPSS
jgi:hypothetical protein